MEVNIQRQPRRKNSTVVGILAMHDDLKPFRGNSQNFVDLIEMGKRHGVGMYVVTPRDLQLHQQKITAYTFSKKEGAWVQRLIPRPTVIYNRVPYRKDENDPYVQEIIKQCMEHPRIRFFNPSFFNKWLLFKWLRRSRKTKSFIPHTVQWDRDVKLNPMFARSQLLYLKPESGKAGAGIMQLRRIGGNVTPYRLSVQGGKSASLYKFKTIQELKNKVHTMIGNGHYIVQQGINLPRYKKRPFDLRVLVQKNHVGEWSITGVGARLAGIKSITTHVPRGGSIDDPLKLLDTVFGRRQAESILRKVRKASLAIARQIESSHKHSLGEMSMDIGVDTKGRIWFFEANAKPMKFDEPHIREKSLENTVLYCKYLARKMKIKAEETGM